MEDEVRQFLRKHLVAILYATEDLCSECPCRDVDKCKECVIDEVEDLVTKEMRGQR